MNCLIYKMYFIYIYIIDIIVVRKNIVVFWKEIVFVLYIYMCIYKKFFYLVEFGIV